jgi:cytochrome c
MRSRQYKSQSWGGRSYARKTVLWMLILIMLFGLVTLAQDKPQTTIKSVPVQETAPTSGKHMYNSYCAVWHGNDGRGGGPAAAAMKVLPT